MDKQLLTKQLNQDDLALEDKLALIDRLLGSKKVQEDFNRANRRPLDTPLDPMDALQCDGCQ